MHALSRPHVSAAAGCGHAPSAPVGPSAASLLLPAPEGWGITRRGRVTDRALGPRVSTPLLRKMTGFSWPLWEGFLLSKTKAQQRFAPTPVCVGGGAESQLWLSTFCPHCPLIPTLGGPRVWVGWEGQSRDLGSKQGVCFYTGMLEPGHFSLGPTLPYKT